MIKIGLTGGIASGKSTVAKMLREMGAIVIDADEIARQVVEPESPAWQEIVAWLGSQILDETGRIKRRVLGSIVFSDQAALKKLEAITHPRILKRLDEMVSAYEKEGADKVVLDIPLLIECAWQNKVDLIWLVYVDEQTQLQRLQTRDNFTASEAEMRIAAQMSLSEKKRFADLIIDNGGTQSETRRQIEEQWRKILL